MKIVMRLYSDDVRKFCIRNGFFTDGTRREYAEMFGYIDNISSFDADNIETIARMIEENSSGYTYWFDIAEMLISECVQFEAILN